MSLTYEGTLRWYDDDEEEPIVVTVLVDENTSRIRLPTPSDNPYCRSVLIPCGTVEVDLNDRAAGPAVFGWVMLDAYTFGGFPKFDASLERPSNTPAEWYVLRFGTSTTDPSTITGELKSGGRNGGGSIAAFSARTKEAIEE